MSQDSLNKSENAQDLHPVQALEQLSLMERSGCIYLSSESVDWLFYLHQGKLVYGTHSIDPLDRLERHLRRLSNQIKSLTRDLVYQIRVQWENNSGNDLTKLAEYEVINWLVAEKKITPENAINLIHNLTQEVLETYLVLHHVVQKDLFFPSVNFTPFCEFELGKFINTCEQRLKIWQSFGKQVTTPWQRPYFFLNPYAQQKLSNEQIQKLGKLLKGYSFYHLAAILHQDELNLVQRFYPLIEHKTLMIREPQSPYNKLPKFSDKLINIDSETINKEDEATADLTISGIFNSSLSLANKVWKIACIDDSQTMLNEMSRFLDADNFSVSTIKDSLKALMQIIRIKPDLILLDVSMPHVDGYKLCSLIRRNSQFKTTPIIMVTAKTGLIDRARARMCGANDYMTKPFTQEELLKMVFRYLS